MSVINSEEGCHLRSREPRVKCQAAAVRALAVFGGRVCARQSEENWDCSIKFKTKTGHFVKIQIGAAKLPTVEAIQ